MAKGKKISEQPIVESLSGNELIPLANNGVNAAVTPDTIKEFANDGLDNTYATIERVNDQLDGFAPKSWLASTDQEVSRINDALISGLSDKVDKDAVPTKVSELENDSEYQDKGHVSAAIKVAINAHETEVEERLSTIEDRIEGLDAHKVSKEEGKELSSNDYTDEDKAKVDNLPENTNFSLAAIKTKVDALDVVVPNKADKTAVYSKTEANDTFVHQVEGKQLSTEDFTTALKEKLQGLTNYDDATLTAELNALKSRLDTLVGSGDVTAVIDTFQEIEAFLQGVTNTQTLTGLLQEMKSEIVQLCADTYLPKSGGRIDSNTTIPLRISSTTQSNSVIYFYNKENQDNNIGYVGYIEDSNIGGFILRNNIANKILGIKDDGTPHYNGNPLLYANGTSSQFLKADGSVDSTAYLPTSGGEVTGKTTFKTSTFGEQLEVYRSLETGAAVIKYSNSTKLLGYIGIGGSGFSHIENQPYFQDSNNNPYRIFHEGNDGAGSGLDADLLDGKHNGELTASALKGVPSQSIAIIPEHRSINYNINIDKNVEGLFYGSNNANSIISLDRFGRNDFVSQLGFNSDSHVYYRAFNGTVPDTTTPWKRFAFTSDNVASADKLTTKQLTNEDLNDIKDVNFSSYFAAHVNTCVNKPTGVAAFTLRVSGKDINNIAQILIDAVNGNIFRRIDRDGTWSSWKKMLTEDDIAGLVSRIEALENQ